MSSPISLIHAHLQSQLERMCADQKVSRWVVAYSGGLDSTVLLHALTKIQVSAGADAIRPIVALHINHQLSPSADSWQRHAQAQAQAVAVEFFAERVVVESRGKGMEDAAREARYAVFNRFVGPDDVLLLAHHADDQVETLLLRLMRGAGLEGLAGIQKTRALAEADSGQLLRPLLDLARADLAAYARAENLHWIEDESNTDTQFDRNFLRAEILPKLAQRWPGFQHRWQAAADHCAEGAKAQRRDMAVLLQRCDPRLERMGCSVNLPILRALEEREQLSLLRYWLRSFGVNSTSAQLGQIRMQMICGRMDAVAEVTLGSRCVRRFDDRLYLLDAQLSVYAAAAEACRPMVLCAESSLCMTLPCGELLVSSSVDSVDTATRLCRVAIKDKKLTVRFRSGGERAKPAGRAHSQTLKKLLQEYRLEPWLRPLVPLIYADEQLVAAVGLWVESGFAIAGDESALSLTWE